jgi:hypothetical protein
VSTPTDIDANNDLEVYFQTLDASHFPRGVESPGDGALALWSQWRLNVSDAFMDWVGAADTLTEAIGQVKE